MHPPFGSVQGQIDIEIARLLSNEAQGLADERRLDPLRGHVDAKEREGLPAAQGQWIKSFIKSRLFGSIVHFLIFSNGLHNPFGF